jgi:putative ABC transport system permease protein
MNTLETFNLAIKAILTNKMRSFLTVLGIVIGVFSVIILIALVTGLQTFITGQISGFGSNLIFVIPGSLEGGRGPGGAAVNRLQFSDVSNIEKNISTKVEVASVITKAAAAKYGNKQVKNMTVTGAEGNYLKIVSGTKIAQGRFLSEGEATAGKRVAVIGKTVVDQLFPDSNPIGKKIFIGTLSYDVIGTMEPKGSTFGQDQDKAAIVPSSAVRKQFGIDKPNAIYVSAEKTEDIPKVTTEIKKILEKRLTTEDFTVQTQEQALSTISQITGVLTLALGGIAAISLLVGGIGVMNIMLVSVTERTREIGLRKALGAKPADIRNQFLIEALTLSGFGGIIGILLGVLVSMIVNQFFTTDIPLWSVALSFGFSMLVGVVFGVAPAIRASNLDPITALRYE